MREEDVTDPAPGCAVGSRAPRSRRRAPLPCPVARSGQAWRGGSAEPTPFVSAAAPDRALTRPSEPARGEVSCARCRSTPASSGLRLAETFVIAREAHDWEDVVQVELTHGGHVGRGEAAPIERYDETPESALAFVEEHGQLLGDDPFALEEIGARLARDPGRAGREGGARRGAPRPPGQAARRPRLAPARAAAGRPADVVDDLARRPRRHGPPHRAGRGAVQAAQAQARRRRRPRRRACPRRALAHRPAAAGRRQRVVVARRGARRDPAARRARRRVRRAAAPRRRSRRGASCGRGRRSRSTSTRTATRSPTSPRCAEIAHGINIKLAKSGRDPRGDPDGPRRARARARRHARLHGRVGARDRRRLRRRAALRPRRPRRQPPARRGPVPGRRRSSTACRCPSEEPGLGVG